MSTKNLTPELANAAPLSPTAVQTANYAAGANQLIPVNALGTAITITLPASPADKTRASVKKVDTSANAVTVSTSGGALFNTAAGPSSVSLTLQNQSVTLQYQSSPNLWIVIQDGLPLDSLSTSLATTYAAKASPTLTGTPLAPTATAGTNTTQIATTAFAAALVAAQSAADNLVSSLGTISSGTLDVSAFLTNGMVLATLGSNITTITLPTGTGTRSITIEAVLTQDATGSRTITFPATIKSSDGTPPILSTTAGAVDTIAFIWDTVRWKVRLVERALS